MSPPPDNNRQRSIQNQKGARNEKYENSNRQTAALTRYRFWLPFPLTRIVVDARELKRKVFTLTKVTLFKVFYRFGEKQRL